MSAPANRIGVLYGRLGLSTDADLIRRRTSGVAASAAALETADVPGLVRSALGLAGSSPSAPWLIPFGEDDPTFEVGPATREAGLLAAAVAADAMAGDGNMGGVVALALVTASCGGMRPPVADDRLLALADEALVRRQTTSDEPARRTYGTQPETLKKALLAAEQVSGVQFNSQAGANYVLAMKALAEYAEATALAAANSDQQVLSFAKQLKQEIRTYWWVFGGWSDDLQETFATRGSAEVAIRAGKELAARTTSPVGLFAAPAMIDTVLRRGRTKGLAANGLAACVRGPDRAWRKEIFGSVGERGLGDLLPVSYMTSLSADSGDSDDWMARFKRETGLDPARKVDAVHLGMQIYRERLTFRALEA